MENLNDISILTEEEKTKIIADVIATINARERAKIQNDTSVGYTLMLNANEYDELIDLTVKKRIKIAEYAKSNSMSVVEAENVLFPHKDLITKTWKPKPGYEVAQQTDSDIIQAVMFMQDQDKTASNQGFEINEFGEIIRPKLGEEVAQQTDPNVIEAALFMQDQNKADFGDDYDKPKRR